MAKYPEYLAPKPPPSKGRRFLRFIRVMSSMSVGLILAVFAAVVLWPYMVITVPSGHVGVLWRRIQGFDYYCWCFVGRGTVLDPRLLREEGLHIIAPWNRLFVYSLRLQANTMTVEAISKDGVNVAAQLNIRYQLVHRSVGVLHKFIGPQYLESTVAPEIGSLAREIISRYPAQEVYRSRLKIQDEIRANAQLRMALHLNMLVQPEAMEQPDPSHYNDYLQNSIQFLDTLVLNIRLPPAIIAAINRQTEQFYQIQEYKFRVEREAEESKRKQIEASGIAAFQRTISQGISTSYLRWRGIEATLALARSPNTKVVIIGSGKDGLPLILGNLDSASTSEKAPQTQNRSEMPHSDASQPAIDKERPKSLATVPETNVTDPGSTKPNTKSNSNNAAPTMLERLRRELGRIQ